MQTKYYYTVVGIVFSVIAIVHAARAINGWDLIIQGTLVPLWVSWAVVALAAYLGLRGLQLAYKAGQKYQ